MTTKSKLVALATLFIAVGGVARAEGFLRPSLLLVSPSVSGASSATGLGLAVGGRFGPQASHEVSFETDWVQWDQSASYGGYHVSGSLRYVPCLVHYRYYLGKASSAARLYVGPSAGFAGATAEVNAIGPDVNLNVSDTTWSAAWGASAGFAIRLAPKVDLDVGYRYLYVKGNDVTISGAHVTLDDAKAHILYAGVSFRF